MGEAPSPPERKKGDLLPGVYRSGSAFQTFTRRYHSAYASRTGDRSDGCLTFWRAQRFRAKTVQTVCMRDHGLRDNVALLVLLEQTAGPQHQDWQWGTGRAEQNGSTGGPDRPPALLVGNTHLLFNPRRGDIKVCLCCLQLSATPALQIRYMA